MPVLTLALLGGAAAFLYVSWASWSAGYTPEVALLRGILAFGALAIIGYAAELIVASQPSRAEQATADALRAAMAGGEPEDAPDVEDNVDADADERVAA